MPHLSKQEKLTQYKSLFKGREDVFAIHWQKGNKSGYMPAYHFDPYQYRAHKMGGGTFKDFKDKTLLPLTDQQITKHLKGDQLIGIYPLLQDNTSWFIAADFDGQHWAEESCAFIRKCEEEGINAYLERSRSGKGGHVWIFFDHPCPAIKSRQLITTLLKQAGVISLFDKSSSFDRLFPNQNLNVIRNKGRHAFLENPPKNFGRIIHDYIDKRKGFVLWKDQLEERLW